jgi:hypothetical protein
VPERAEKSRKGSSNWGQIMKEHFFPVILVGLLMGVSVALAEDCTQSPLGANASASAANWNRYAAWCSACGGTPDASKNSCTQGPNWGKGQSSSAAATSATDAASQLGFQIGQGIGRLIFGDPAAERAAEEQKRQVMQTQGQMARERADQQEQTIRDATRMAQQLDDRSRQETASNLAGIPRTDDLAFGSSTSFFGVPANPTDPRLGANDNRPGQSGCNWGDQASSVVDLRCLGLDPDKPVAIDPHVVRGQERVFPAQIDPATFENVNYNKGFEALMRPTFSVNDAMDAVNYFQLAKLQRPNDPMVRNGLLLGQDIVKARQQKEKDDQSKAAYLTLQGHAALMMGDTQTAKGYLAQARQLDPNDKLIQSMQSLAEIDLGPQGTYPERRAAYRLVANSLATARRQEIGAAAAMMEAAHSLQPYDTTISAYLDALRKYPGSHSPEIHN